VMDTGINADHLEFSVAGKLACASRSARRQSSTSV
jgi:hypothetical protein